MKVTLGPANVLGINASRISCENGVENSLGGGETFGLIWVALPSAVAQTTTLFLVCAMELFISCLRGRKIRLHVFLLRPRFCHFILQPLHHGHDLLHGHFLTRSARWALSRGPHSSTFSLTLSCCYGSSDKLSGIVELKLVMGLMF